MAARTALASASAISRSFRPAPAANLVPRRGLAGGGDHHGPPKVNIWEDPLNPSKWKEEHFVLASLAGWGLLCYGGYKLFAGKKEKKEKKEEIDWFLPEQEYQFLSEIINSSRTGISVP